MACEKLGVDVIINTIEENPSCTHGPSILFERYQEGGKSRQFFACSACRDRRQCTFFHWARQKFSQSKHDLWAQLIAESRPTTSHEDEYKRYSSVEAVAANKRRYCTSCSTLLTKADISHHKSCSLISHITDAQLTYPSTLLSPKESSKCEAQYLFAEKSLVTLRRLVCGLGVSRVLCVGAPRLHEAITHNQHSSPLTSLMLDIDDRYGKHVRTLERLSYRQQELENLIVFLKGRMRSFFSPDEFLHYNMFNHHFFDGEKARKTYLNFMSGEGKVAVVTDPPFGGRMELLAHNLQRIQEDWRTARSLDSDAILPILFIFPYFMEAQVLSNLPTFTMLDYQVDYDNHPLYSSGPKGMKNGSAVRIFTNQESRDCPLPESEGYRWCEECQRWVSQANIHCNKCGGCMSKDGRTYKHCESCGKCVKPSWEHCSGCARCQPQDHQCRPNTLTAAPTCHACGATGHKRSQCHKRSNTAAPSQERKKKRKKDSYPQNLDDERQRNLKILQDLM